MVRACLLVHGLSSPFQPKKMLSMRCNLEKTASLVGARFYRLFFVAMIVGTFQTVAVAADKPSSDAMPKPPHTRAGDVVETLHGQRIADPYRWLEDQQSPETRAWIDQQNAFSKSILSKLPKRAAIARRLGELLKVDEVSVPVARGGRYFFMRRGANEDLARITMREGLAGKDLVLINPQSLSKDHRTSVLLLDVSEDGRLLAYGVRRGGEDEITVKLFDVDARADLNDVLPRARYFGVSISADRRGLYYTRHGESGSRVFYHVLGESTAGDRLLFGEGYGPEKIIETDLSDDGRQLLITVYYGSAAKKTELYYLRTADVLRRPEPELIVNFIDARFEGEIADGKIFLLTNYKAPRGRILVADLEHPDPDHWKEIVPESEAILRSMSLVGGRVAANYLDHVHSRVALKKPDGSPAGEITFERIGSLSGLAGRWKTDEAFFTFSSFNVPPTIYRDDVSTGKRSVWARQQVPLDSEQFEVEQVEYASKDGTRIPMFLMHKKGLRRDGRRPTLLTGYGGFNISLTPRFSPLAILWAEQGGVFAVPNLRGGGEFGETWHQAGMLKKKQNVFDDFIAAAEWLIREKYTSPEKLAIRGASNGGLLVGAAMTQRPDLFQAVVCRYPLLDMIRYHKFLVARFWVPEYGSAEDAELFKSLLAYSPYHHVRSGIRYPAVLFVTGDADTRVDPLHARKMTAMMQARSASGRPVLLRYDTKAGHSRGSTPVPKQVEEMTDELAFLFALLKVDVHD